MAVDDDLGLQRILFDPFEPQLEYFTTAFDFAAARAKPLLPHPVPWPVDGEPKAAPIVPTPDPESALPTADVLLVTWTAAEARAMTALFTPGHALEDWYRYRHNVDAFIPKVKGARAPFNGRRYEQYYHTLGLYAMCLIGQAKVLCFKSGLHMDYDGPDIPVRDLWRQIIAEVNPELVITTGTGGGIGSDILLGDVIVSGAVRFFCTKQFSEKPFAQAEYSSTALPKRAFESISQEMLNANAKEFEEENSKPLKIVYPGVADYATPKIVSTDFFAFDDTKNTDHLQDKGQACDMGDATLGYALEDMQLPPKWIAIRNASDGQMDGNLPRDEQRRLAGTIYMKYGMFTSAGSLVASWAAIREAIPKAKLPMFAIATAAPEALVPQPLPHATPLDPTSLLFVMVARNASAKQQVEFDTLDADRARKLRELLPSDLINPQLSTQVATLNDPAGQRRNLTLFHVSSDTPNVFRGSFLFDGNTIVSHQEFTAKSPS